MSDIEGTSPATAATNPDVNETAPVQDVATPENKVASLPPEDPMEVEQSADIAPNVDADSEAETLIQSPEKRRAAALSLTGSDVKMESIEPGDHIDERAANKDVGMPPNDFSSRKRKRPEDDGPSRSRKVPSAPSSVLSSPSPDELQADSNDEHSRNPRQALHPAGRPRYENREASQERDHKRRDKFDGHIKVKKRRPSDVLTDGQRVHSAKQRPATESQDRRETRSATYPRHSSEERSPSPRALIRGHKRVQSTQTLNPPGSVSRAKQIPPLLTGRGRRGSEDGHSVSTDRSGSPAPSIPNLRKFTSTDHDNLSPVKQAVPSSYRRGYRDQNGRTRLAKACADDRLDLARTKYDERPEDLNVADNAGNTPLQIAALEGFVNIVDFLLSKGCIVDTRNIDKETPLIDAVENGHVDVVRLLLDNGANPRTANPRGEEPYDLVPADDENYGAIRSMLQAAKNKQKDVKRRKSDEHENNTSRAASAASPRETSPVHTPRSPPPPPYAPRRKTGRSEQTRNDLLYQANTQENLQVLAAKGDSAGVAQVISVLEHADTPALIAAARGGHDSALGMMLAMGRPDPDPQPVRTGEFKSGYNTPMLAAIGRGNVEVIKLLLGQTGFNPRKRDGKGRSYPEISKDRRGEGWEEEYRILKEAYDGGKSPEARKQESPRKVKERERDAKRPDRRSPSPSRVGRKIHRSPTATTKDAPVRPSDHHRDSKRDRLATDSKPSKSIDRDQSPAHVKTHRTRRSQGDLPVFNAEAEIQRRRRLISGKEFKERRTSIASQRSSSDNDTAEARANIRREVKREKSLLKRSRDSMTPERPPSRGPDAARDAQKKRRRVLSDSSPEEIRMDPLKRKAARSPDLSPPAKEQRLTPLEKPAEPPARPDLSDSSELVEAATQPAKPEPVEKVDAVALEAQKKREEEAAKLVKEEENRKKEAEEERARAEAERLAAEAAEAARLKAEEDAREAEEKKRAEDEAAAAAEKLRLEEEAAARQREEEERQQKLRREEEERQRRVEERRRREAEEQEKIRREALPALLCKTAEMIDTGNPEARDHSWLKKFLPLFSVFTRQLAPACSPETAEDEWIPNFQAAGLLAAKDLHLRQYTQLEKRPATDMERRHLWKVAGVKLSTDYHANAYNTKMEDEMRSYRESGEKFSTMEPLFWVRLSDFKDLIPLHSHLRGLDIKTQRIGLQPIKPAPPTEQTRPNGITSPSHAANGILPNGVPNTNGYHAH